MNNRGGKIHLDHEEVLQTLRFVAKGAKTPADLMKLSSSPKTAISGRLNVLIRAHFVKAEESEPDRRYKNFTPSFEGMQKAFVKLIKTRCKKRVDEIQKQGASKEELLVLEEPEKLVKKTLPVFETFNDSLLGKSLFKELIKHELEEKDNLVTSIDDVFEKLILVYSGLPNCIPNNVNRMTREKLEAVAVCCSIARKFNVFPLEELACEYLKKNAEK